MKKTTIHIIMLFVMVANVIYAEDLPGDLLVNQSYSRKDNPILDILVFHQLTAFIQSQSTKPSYAGDTLNARPNTPWSPHQWASHFNRKNWDSAAHKAFSETLNKEFGGSSEHAFHEVSNTLNRSAYFLISKESTGSPFYPIIARDRIWEILRPGDTVFLDNGDQNVHVVTVYSKSEEAIFILDAWPQRFFFRSTGNRIRHGLADLVKVKKKDFMEYCAQVITLDSLNFPKNLVNKYFGSDDDSQRLAALFSFAVQLTNVPLTSSEQFTRMLKGYSRSMKEGYDLLKLVIEEKGDYDPGFELNARDLRDFAAIFLYHYNTTLLSRSGNDLVRQDAKKEIEMLKQSLEGIKPRQTELFGRLKADHLYRLAEVASLHDLTSAEEFYNLTLAKDPNHIEALTHRAATRVSLNKIELAKKDIQNAKVILEPELDRLKKLVQSLRKIELPGGPMYEGRPDIFERIESLQEAQQVLVALKQYLN